MKLIQGVSLEKFAELAQGKDVLCVGIGQMFMEAMEDMKEYNIKITYLFDSSPKKINKNINARGLQSTIIDTKEIAGYVSSGSIILITSKYYEEIFNLCNRVVKADDIECYSYLDLHWNDSLLNRSMQTARDIFRRRGITKEDAEKKIKQDREDWQRKNLTVIPKINIIVTDKCSLRCKDCRALMPLMNNPCDVPLEEIKEEIDILLYAVDKVIDIEPIGGEPFVYPYIAEVIEYLTSNDKVENVVISTNGTIIPGEKATNALKNNKVLVCVSDYGQLEKMAKFISHLEKNEVSFMVETNQIWFDVGGLEYRNRDKKELKTQYRNCYCQYLVKYVWDKKIWVCPRAPRLSSLGVLCDPNDYYELDKNEDVSITRKKIMDSFYAEYAEACNYCNQGELNIPLVEAGIQSNGKIEKSQYTIVKREEYEQLMKAREENKYEG